MMRRRDRRGSNIIEFSLLLPVFFTLIAGAIDVSWALSQQAALDDAVHRACRAGALVDPGDREAFVGDVVAEAERVLELAMTASVAGGCGDGGCDAVLELFGDPPTRSMRCDVQSEFTPLLGIVMSESTMTAGTVAMMEWQRWPE
ncbi:MAG: pilus assembly protein [Deltaproteobacteria bacterium]|nr:MAG: pilus assembly protein [Deltaproteobacteria bacterium]